MSIVWSFLKTFQILDISINRWKGAKVPSCEVTKDLDAKGSKQQRYAKDQQGIKIEK